MDGNSTIRSKRAARRDAVAALYDSEYGALIRLARLLEADRAVAEDLVHDAFVRLYRSWGKIREPEAAPMYLRRILINLAASRARRAILERREASELSAEPESVSDLADDCATRDEVIGALHKLSSRQRQCLVLRHYAGYSESEIADAVGCSIGSVRTHCKRGMAQLRVLLRTREPEWRR